MPTLWWESRELFETLWAYCKQDVLAEFLLSETLPDLSDYEQEVYWADQEANERGFLLDRDGVDAALALISEENRILLEEFQTLTQGQIESPRQRAKLMTWLGEQGLVIANTRKDTVDDILEGKYYASGDLNQSVFRVLEILRQLGASSTAKYESMSAQMCVDSRVRGGMLYHGATTGRWSGAGVQPHNFPKGVVDRCHEPTKNHPDWLGMETSWDVVKTAASREDLQDIFAAPTMPVLSSILRGAIVAPPGRQLYIADYAGIEARVLLWLAEDEEALGVFHRGEDIYCVMAEAIYGYPCNKTDHPTERGIGKIAVLGLGYQMGWSRFIDTAALGGVTLTEDFSRRVVDAYRAKFHRVKSMWYDQERVAIQATVDEGCDYGCGKMVWERVQNAQKGTDFLYCHLPSGRRLAYPNPQVRLMPTSWGDMKEALTFMGIDTYTRQWRRQQTYGGSLVENQTQAVARDFMADAFLTLSKSPVYDVTMTVHDEIVSEAHPLQGNIREFEHILTTLPDWGEGCPIAAEGFTGKRYRK
jgi:DNA polymerase